MAEVALEGVGKVFDNGVVALANLNLQVGDGELLVLVGPSGSGKTTCLRLVAGLEAPTCGQVRIGGQRVNDVPAHRRHVAMVFQRPALFPHLNVRDNLLFGLRLRQPWSWLPGRGLRWLATLITRPGRLPRFGHQEAEEQQAVEEASRLLGLGSVLHRYPPQLSGGQQQRVALGRALVRRAGVYLLDEPLGQLDFPLRRQLSRELHLLQRQLAATMIYVTHDPREALQLGQRVAVLSGGVLHQVAAPAELLRHPCHPFVAEFFQAATAPVLAGFEG